MEGFKLHSLRHTFATRLILLGVDIYTVSKILGHSDIKTSMVYAKTTLGTLQSAISRLGDNRIGHGTLMAHDEGGEKKSGESVLPG